MKNPIENMPLQEMTRAIFQRLDGNLKKLDGSTVVPIYDSFPEVIAVDDKWDYVEIAGFDVEPEPARAGLSVYSYVAIINIVSSYNGQREIEGVCQQLNSYLASTLSLTGFTDMGSAFRRCTVEKMVLEENRIVRRGVYRRQWYVSDHKR